MDVASLTQAAHSGLLDRGGMSRRAFLALCGIGGTSAALALGGCGLFGGGDPQPEEADVQEQLPSNAVNFEGLVFTLNTDASTWSWGQINNAESSANGAIIVGIPVTETNNDELSRVVNSLYCKVIDPSGTELADVSGFYAEDDILQKGSIAVGGSVSGVLHFPYMGAGTYTVQFDNLLGGKASLPFEVGAAQAAGIRAYPQTSLSQTDAEKAAYMGTPFDVCGMTLTLSSDPATYYWTQTWNQEDPAWDGQWCFAVPLTIYNGSGVAQNITFDQYAIYAPGLERINDPGAYFQETHVSFQPAVQPGETQQTWLWWTYQYDGSYYVCIDSNGVKRVASVYVTWPQQ